VNASNVVGQVAILVAWVKIALADGQEKKLSAVMNMQRGGGRGFFE